MDFIGIEVKKLTITLLICDFLIVIITLIGGFLNLNVIFGMIYGFVFAELMFILLGKLVERALSMDEHSAKKFMRTNYAIRFILTGVILAIPFVSVHINPWCVVVSMLSPKFTYFSIGFYETVRDYFIDRKG